MRIIRIHIQGFRSLADVDWQPGSLNVVIGPNGSGKSNLLKALEMLSLSARGKLGEQVVREGGMEPLVWDGRTPKISFQLRTETHSPADGNSSKQVLYYLELMRLGSTSSYRIEKEVLDDGAARTPQRPHALIERDQYEARVYDGDQKQFSVELGSDGEDEETILSQLRSPYQQTGPDGLFNKYLASWRIYQNLSTHLDAPIRRAPVSRHETQVAADGSNLIQVLHTLYTGNRDFKHDLDLAMKAAFGDDFEEIVFPPDADQRIQLRLRWKSLQRAQSAADLSDGTLRFLYLIAILANPNPPALIAIDEPETGLHPSMLPIIAEYAAEAALHTQVIFTTHSAEFLDAFSESPPATTVARWADGRTELKVVSEEQLRYWLEDYTLGKLYRSGNLESME